MESAAVVRSMTKKEQKPSPSFVDEKTSCTEYFEKWTEYEQIEFVEHLLSHMCHYQHGQINAFLRPMLQRDFISALPGEPNYTTLLQFSSRNAEFRNTNIMSNIYTQFFLTLHLYRTWMITND